LVQIGVGQQKHTVLVGFLFDDFFHRVPNGTQRVVPAVAQIGMGVHFSQHLQTFTVVAGWGAFNISGEKKISVGIDRPCQLHH